MKKMRHAKKNVQAVDLEEAYGLAVHIINLWLAHEGIKYLERQIPGPGGGGAGGRGMAWRHRSLSRGA